MRKIPKIRVLITGAGAPGAAGIIKCLKQSKKIEVWTCDANSEASGRFIEKRFFQIPTAKAADFTSELLRLVRKYKIQIVMPLVTNELLVLSKNKRLFEKEGVHVLVSNYEALSVANDKSKLYQSLSQYAIVVPEFSVVNDVKSFQKAVKKLGYPSKRVVFKPSISNGSRGFRIMDDKVDRGKLLWTEKPNNTFISYQEIMTVLRESTFPELLVSEFLPGEEYSVDCLADNGKCLVAVPRLRSKILNGISVGGEFVNEKAIIDYCGEIIGCLKLHGNIGIQVKKGADGVFKILEINPRVQGTIVTNLEFGINLPLLAVKLALHEKVKIDRRKFKWGLRFVRVWKEIYYT